MTTMITLPGVNGHDWICPECLALTDLASVLAGHGLKLAWHRQQRRLVVIPTA